MIEDYSGLFIKLYVQMRNLHYRSVELSSLLDNVSLSLTNYGESFQENGAYVRVHVANMIVSIKKLQESLAYIGNEFYFNRLILGKLAMKDFPQLLLEKSFKKSVNC
jgi:hypothetical protein